MSSSVSSITLNENASKSLATVLSLNSLQCPVAASLDQQKLTLSPLSSATDATQQDLTELVVFEQLTLQQLANISTCCQVNIVALNAINTRLGKTSLRFTIECDNLDTARSALTDFCLTHGIEAALIKNAPKLAVPGLLVMDMDSTTIEIECIDEIAKLAGVGEQVAEVTERAMLGS